MVADSVSDTLMPADQGRDLKHKWSEINRELAELSQPRMEERSTEKIRAAEQRLIDFFVQSYHPKDSLKNDAATTGIVPGDVEKKINADADLRLLADLANLAEHGKFDNKHPPRSGQAPILAHVSGKGDGQTIGWYLKLTIGHGSKNLDGLQVAADAVKAWQRALSQWGLI